MSTQTTTVRHLDNAVTTFSKSFVTRGVMPVGMRMTAVRLQNGDLFVVSPTPLGDTTDANGTTTLAELEKLGKVKYVVCPNIVHHLHAAEYKQKWPDAVLIGVPGLQEKRDDVKFDVIVEGVKPIDAANPAPAVPPKRIGFEDEISYRHFSGQRNQDTLYLHRPSKTLLTADLMINFPLPKEQGGPSGTAGDIFNGAMQLFLKPDAGAHKLFNRYLMNADTEQMKSDVKHVLDNWKFDRIIPCHGTIVETDAEKAFKEAFSWFL
ncbi:uncharacterized protein EV422DRAFT_216377 [Fimicolochytrium jonesii]|uniref:uncharacterized protein n=1 Tax=Fimicolochytrium jonesii TaxID=1396493 RepID=UPI0022FE3C64|nr:uncharacterized protein EV422DRAFT_216377 [Fimicolochytrium jonesii]KAI8817520.1 hypothetical protein EV422DRAFT_216377 [Fimicolochytrium jonesii]